MAKVYIDIEMVMFMKVIGMMMLNMVKVNTLIIIKVLLMMVNGIIMLIMVMEF